MQNLLRNGTLRFSFFEVDMRSGELRKRGVRVPLQQQPFRILIRLVERRGEAVTREELRQELWPADTYVDFEQGINAAVKRLREALGDSAESPRFIETLPKRGYRFIAPVDPPLPSAADVNGDETDPHPGEKVRLRSRQRVTTFALALAAIVCAAAAAFLWTGRRQVSLPAMAEASLVRRPAAAADARAIVALPFRTLSGTDDQYVAEGIGEAVTTALSNLHGLVVISRNSAAAYKGRVVDPREIGKAFGVTHVLDGTVQRSGPRLRVTVQLADATTGLQVWGAQYNRERPETFALQDAIATDLTRALRPDAPAGPRRSAPTAHLGAYDEYLRGRFEFHADRVLNASAAIARFERATALDPQFALAHAALATAYASRFFYRQSDRALEQKAFVAIEKALAIDPNLAEAHLARANLLWTLPNDFPHERAVAEYRRAIGLNPNLADARSALARVLMHLGFTEEASAELKIAIQLDPSDGEAAGRISHCYFLSHQHERALAELEHTSSWFKAHSLMHVGRMAEALQVARADVARATRDKSHTETETRSTYALVLARSGDRTGAERELATLAPRLANPERYSHMHHAQYSAACAYALLGRKREAIHWLQTATDEGFPAYPFYKGDPSLAGLRGDPAFEAFLAQLEKRWQHYRAALFGL